jgi:hypothetical protein
MKNLFIVDKIVSVLLAIILVLSLYLICSTDGMAHVASITLFCISVFCSVIYAKYLQNSLK